MPLISLYVLELLAFGRITEAHGVLSSWGDANPYDVIGPNPIRLSDLSPASGVVDSLAHPWVQWSIQVYQSLAGQVWKDAWYISHESPSRWCAACVEAQELH